MNTLNNQLKYEKALEYEIFIKEEYNFAKQKIQKAKCIFDVWWHIWFFSKWCRKYNSIAKIHYFEPVGEFYTQANTKLWNDQNIIMNNYWISSKSEIWTILFNNEKTMQSSKYLSFLNPKWKEIKVKFITLNEYLKINKIQNIDILKMDIEWMEFEVLSSRWNYELLKIDNLIIEIHLLNNEMKIQRNQIFLKIKNFFWNVQIFPWYRKEIFILRAYK